MLFKGRDYQTSKLLTLRATLQTKLATAIYRLRERWSARPNIINYQPLSSKRKYRNSLISFHLLIKDQ